MNSEEKFLTIKINYKGKSFDIKSKDVITLKHLREKSINYFRIQPIFKDSVNFIVKDNDNNNDNNDKINILSDDNIIKDIIEKSPQNSIIKLLLTINKNKGIKLMEKDKEKNNKIFKKNAFKIISNDNINIEGNMKKVNELNIEINKYKKYKEDYLKLEEKMQILKIDLENYKEEISILKEENLILKNKINNFNKDFEIIKKKKEEYIKTLEAKLKEYKNLIDININSRNKPKEKDKLVDINIQSNLEKLNFNEEELSSINNPIPNPMREEHSSFTQNYRNDNIIKDLNPANTIDKVILEMELNLNDNLNNINIEESINKNKTRKFLSRNEEIKKEINEINLNPKTEIRKRTIKNFDIDKINKIREKCGDQVKNYSDEKIQKILDENGGNYIETITDIMLRLSKIIYK